MGSLCFLSSGAIQLGSFYTSAALLQQLGLSLAALHKGIDHTLMRDPGLATRIRISHGTKVCWELTAWKATAKSESNSIANLALSLESWRVACESWSMNPRRYPRPVCRPEHYSALKLCQLVLAESLIELFESIYVFGKLPYNRLSGHPIATNRFAPDSS